MRGNIPANCVTLHRAREHNKWHNGATFDCKICGARFAKSTSHLTHMRLQHPTDNSCEICGESSTLIICDGCGSSFKNKDAIKRSHGNQTLRLPAVR
ncbi:unnamed protein product [Leptidea sinapis]|uniref:C2H2-type domain-containing protein n=1 Tax=Leptidea sinapis TaxID=189913 RepID=A0A5E4QES8_9NEOP|nr:unnamed protein product [Leptidea sinapis]